MHAQVRSWLNVGFFKINKIPHPIQFFVYQVCANTESLTLQEFTCDFTINAGAI